MMNIGLFSLAIIPSLILLWYVYIKDKIEKEPIYLLTLLFIGGIIACIISILLSTLLKQCLPFFQREYTELNLGQILWKILISTTIIEEGSKWLINRTIWQNKNFNYLYDSIVYSVFVALGFATLENILYGISFHAYGVWLLIGRGLISIPSHAIFGVFMGYYLGIAKSTQTDNKKKQAHKYQFTSILLPIILHTLYNLLLIKRSLLTTSIFGIYLITICLLAIKKINRLSSATKKLEN